MPSDEPSPVTTRTPRPSVLLPADLKRGGTGMIVAVVVLLLIVALVVYFMLTHKKHDAQPPFVPPPQYSTKVIKAAPVAAGGPSPTPAALTVPFATMPSGTYSGSHTVQILFFAPTLHVSAPIVLFDEATLTATTDVHITVTGIVVPMSLRAPNTAMTISRTADSRGLYTITPSGSAWNSQIAPKLKRVGSQPMLQWDPTNDTIHLSGSVVGHNAQFELTK